MKKLIYILAYFTLIGAPRALIIKNSSDDTELSTQPLWVVFIGEFLFRLGIFFVIAAGIEETIGDAMFEHLHSDLFLGTLILCGVLHTAVYFLSFTVLINRSMEMAERSYRFGRNLCYSSLPAFPVAAAFILYQDTKRILYENPQIIEIAFASTWALFAVIGIAEWAYVKRRPIGLGDKFEKSII
jgi:hypothetical protein